MGCLQLSENKDTKVKISDGEYVTVTEMGHIVEVQHMKRKNRACHIQKLDADRYVHLESGEILEYQKSENRGESENSLRQTFKKMRYLINNNFKGKGNELHVTLTYAENMQDTVRLYKDFKYFIDRLRYKYPGVGYVSVIEPQERGAWHMHVLMRFNDDDKVYIKNSVMAELWGHGYVKIKTLRDVDNIGAYLSAYLADVELPEGVGSDGLNVVIRKVDGQEKKFVKGARLWRYPPGINLYRASRDMKMPERTEMTYKQAKKIVGSAEPHFKKSYEVARDDFENTITYEQYNLLRD